MTLNDIGIVSSVTAWVASIAIPVVIPTVRVDATVSLILMAVTGAMIAFRDRKEETRRDDG